MKLNPQKAYEHMIIPLFGGLILGLLSVGLFFVVSSSFLNDKFTVAQNPKVTIAVNK